MKIFRKLGKIVTRAVCVYVLANLCYEAALNRPLWFDDFSRFLAAALFGGLTLVYACEFVEAILGGKEEE